MCLLIFFFKQWLFFWPLIYKAQLCGVYGLKWSYGQILQSPLWSFAAHSGLSLVSLLPLINALLAWSVSFCGRPSLGRFVVVPYCFHFLIMDLMVLCGMFKVSDLFLEPNPDLYFSTTLSLTCLESSLVFMVPLAWWSPLLSGVAESGAFQNRCTVREKSI